MLTVPEAAARVGRDPETIRRWIRSGKLRSQKVGTQHLVAEADLWHLAEEPTSRPMPAAWHETWTGEPPVDWVRLIHRSRRGH
jgi:excisionase family DNA binding protein